MPAPHGNPGSAQSLNNRGSEIDPGGIQSESRFSVSNLDDHVAQVSSLGYGQDGSGITTFAFGEDECKKAFALESHASSMCIEKR